MGVAAPVFAADGEVFGSLSFVTLDKRWALLDQAQLVGILLDGARRITQAVALVSSPRPQRKAA